MKFKEQFIMQLKDIGKDNFIKNRSILEIFENIATHHSDMAGYGPNDIKKTGITWVLLDWKVQVIKRPKYGDKLNVSTWGRLMKKVYTYRDFTIYDENENLLAIGTSKWVLVDTQTRKITKISNDVKEKYTIEEESVFNIEELDKLKPPEEYSKEIEYTVARRDIDFNGHMHNLYYLDLAYEVLPEEVYDQRPFDNFRIQYKREIKYGDKVKCKYTFKNGEHIVTIVSEDENTVHAIIILK
jgi:medium-chain acyl-[acyl-carrier-protein] hydrolase